MEADAQLHARGRRNAARTGVDPGQRPGHLPELRPLAEASRAGHQGRSRAAPRETPEAEPSRHRRHKGRARRLRQQLRRPRCRQAYARPDEPRRLHGRPGCSLRGRRTPPPTSLRPRDARVSRRRAVRSREHLGPEAAGKRRVRRRGEFGPTLFQRRGPGRNRYAH